MLLSTINKLNKKNKARDDIKSNNGEYSCSGCLLWNISSEITKIQTSSNNIKT